MKKKIKPIEITTINFGGINCYLIKTSQKHLLIDSGFPAKRDFLEKELQRLGCKQGNLELVILTHGDHDHSGNCVYLREKYGAKIVMHADDFGMVEYSDMGWNRKTKPDKISLILRITRLFTSFFNPGKFEPFKPDSAIDEGFDFSPFGFDAKVLHLPGHSAGSIGILTINGDLFCGDLIYNFFNKPGGYYINDLSDYKSSIQKLKRLSIKKIFPGHGKPFLLENFIKHKV
jgi:hydroxyacylglutathione hydrolase